MSDTEENSFKTAPTDLTTEMAAQGDIDPPDRVPFSETVKSLARDSRKRKTHSTNLRLLVMATNQPPVLSLVTAPNQKKMAALITPLISSQFSIDSATDKVFL